MPTFLFTKLVRDKIWSMHVASGHTVHGRTPQGVELRQALCAKLHEEADEVDAALVRDDLIEEIADVRQILDDLCREEGISEQEVLDARDAKAEKKGGFQGGQYIESVTMPTEDEWVLYCRKTPEKYPEVA